MTAKELLILQGVFTAGLLFGFFFHGYIRRIVGR